MTAEIAVMNKAAVALAADSAVTIKNGNSPKIYNGAEKLFALTKFHPVGIMVYGTGSLCNVPWELIVKEYRKKLGEKCFDTLEQYAEDFFDFLCGADRIVPEGFRENSLKSIFLEVFDILVEAADGQAEEFYRNNNRPPSDEESFEIFESLCDEVTGNISQSEFFQGFDDQSILDLSDYTHGMAEEIIKAKIGAVEFPDTLKKKIAFLFAVVVCRQNNLGVKTGVVFAGYGDQEYFPVVLAFNVQGYCGRRLRYAPDPSKSAIAGQSGLQAYAQDEEVITFMSGVAPVIESGVRAACSNMLENVLQTSRALIEEAYGEGTREANEALQKLVDSANAEFDKGLDSLEQLKKEKHVDKVLQMIDFLPKEDLAYMAESLVNMTAFKRKVSNESETVGGPIDVAVISKGDGFIWVRRKHYFKQDLNDHYFRSFLKGV